MPRRTLISETYHPLILWLYKQLDNDEPHRKGLTIYIVSP